VLYQLVYDLTSFVEKSPSGPIQLLIRPRPLLPSINNYDFIILQSFIWDVTRYNDNDGDIYLNNLDLCLSNLKELNKKVI